MMHALMLAAALGAATPAPDAQTLEAVRLLGEFTAIPSQSADGSGVRQAAAWLESKFSALGFETRALAGGAESNPVLLASRAPRAGKTAAATVMFYMHYDTQPTGGPDDWASTGGESFGARLLSDRFDQPGARALQLDDLDEAALRSARIYGRGVADDKAPIVMHLMALAEFLTDPLADRLHLKFLLDGEEEAGSVHMAEVLARNPEALRSDLIVINDGPMDALGRPAVYLGTRGDMHARLRLRTAASSAHSGNYGLLPNAAFRMASLLASMKDARGRIHVEGIEQGSPVPTESERETLRAASLAEAAIAAELGTPAFEGDPAISYYERLLFHPSLIVNQVASGRPGNQIPVVAEAILEVRLVPGQEAQTVFEALRRHVAKLEPAAELELMNAAPGHRVTPADPAVARGIAAIRAALPEARRQDLLVYPSLGGTLPLLGLFAEAGHRYVGLPLVNYDNNQHVANENLRLAVLPEGIALLRRLYGTLAAQ